MATRRARLATSVCSVNLHASEKSRWVALRPPGVRCGAGRLPSPARQTQRSSVLESIVVREYGSDRRPAQPLVHRPRGLVPRFLPPRTWLPLAGRSSAPASRALGCSVCHFDPPVPPRQQRLVPLAAHGASACGRARVFSRPASRCRVIDRGGLERIPVGLVDRPPGLALSAAPASAAVCTRLRESDNETICA